MTPNPAVSGVTRREFFRRTLAGGAALAASSVVAWEGRAQEYAEKVVSFGDLNDIIYTIHPMETPFLSAVGGPHDATVHQWIYEPLEPIT